MLQSLVSCIHGCLCYMFWKFWPCRYDSRFGKESNPICDNLGLPHALLCAYFEFACQQKFDIIKGVEFWSSYRQNIVLFTPFVLVLAIEMKIWSNVFLVGMFCFLFSVILLQFCCSGTGLFYESPIPTGRRVWWFVQYPHWALEQEW